MNKIFSIIFIWGLLGLPVICLGAEPVEQAPGIPVEQAPGIIVQSSASVESDEVLLKDVAVIEAQGLIRQMLGEISLGRSPKPGKVKTFSRRQILSSLRFRQDLVDGLGVEIPDRVFVKRSSQVISSKQIRSYLEDYLAQEFHDQQVMLERLDLPEPDQYPMGEISMAASSTPRMGRDGKFSLGLEVFVDGHKEDRLRISGRIAIYEEVVVAARNLSRDLTLSKEDGVLVKKNMFGLGGEAMISPFDLDGKRLAREVKKGEPLLLEWVKPIPVVHKGDVVTLVAQKDSILIQTSGICREDGFKNSLIEVENIRSGKVIKGLVREPSTVEVVY